MRVLVLPGGGAKGFALLGVLKALEECEMDPDVMVGVSIGALIAVGYSLVGDANRLIEISEILSRKVGSILPSFNTKSRFFRFIASIYVSTFSQVMSLERRMKLLKPHLEDLKFEDLKKKVVMISTDLKSGEMVIHETGSVYKALISTMSIPGIFPSVEMNDSVLCDGGVLTNLPIDVALRYDPDEVIAIRMKSSGSFELRSAVDMMEMVDRIRRNNLENLSIRSSPVGITVVDLRLDDVGLLDFKEGVKLIDVGYSKAIEILKAS